LKVETFFKENNVFEATDFQSVLMMGDFVIIDLPYSSLNSKIGSKIRKKKKN
jgi:hypothetical protein